MFSGLAAGKPRTAHSLLRSNGRGWANPCSNALPAARIAARIDPPISFHGLRHTCAIRLAMKGVPLAVIAAQLGHSNTLHGRGALWPSRTSYVADTVRAAFGPLGIVEPTNV